MYEALLLNSCFEHVWYGGLKSGVGKNGYVDQNCHGMSKL